MATQPSTFRRTLSRWLSAETLTKKAYLNALSGVLDYAAQLLVGFLVNPLLVGGLGSGGFGLWQVLRQLMGYITPASGRPTQALKWTIAHRQASTDYEDKRRQVGSTVVVWLLFLPLLSGLGALLAWFSPTWFRAPPELHSATRWAAALLAAHLVLMSLVDVPRSVLAGENLQYKRMGLSALLVLLGGALTALALYLGTGLVGVAACPLLTGILTGLLFLRVARKHVSWFGIARPSSDAVRRFLGLSGWFLLWRLVMQVMRASDVVLLGMLDSIETVSAYSLTKYVPEALVGVIAMVAFGTAPGLGGIIGAGQLEKARGVRSELMCLTWLVSTVVGTAVVLWNRAFVELWVGGEYYSGFDATLLIVAMVTQFVLIRNDANVIDLTLNVRNKVLLGATSALLSLVAAAVLVGPFEAGVPGLCVGFMAGRAILSLAYPWMVGRTLGISLLAQLRAALRPLVVAGGLFALVVFLDGRVAIEGWLYLVAGVGTTVGVVTPLAFLLGLSRQQQVRMLRRLRF